ncbi:MAG: phosphoglucomutase/phosphomannomutase family protein [Chroococcus sp. CMT-3BRIN-NPC107]|jgi:phosphomannomutase|nr:phosphoglucomutase/phosphomannomutase family protein [Chroococcus sp. CMT-3BRIN-NPC107]
MPVATQGIKFGTDGWRGIIGDDFTFDRLTLVAPIAAKVLSQTYGATAANNIIIVGYDRRFMAETFAQKTADAVVAAGFDVLLAGGYASTPAFSWAVKHYNALGALVITASHNPGSYLGLKVKGAFGGSVPPEVTEQIEALLSTEQSPPAKPGTLQTFEPWANYCQTLSKKVNINQIRSSITSGKLAVFVDVMHGAATGGMAQILGVPVQEINANRDPLFGGGAPEPLPRYLSKLFRTMRSHNRTKAFDSISVGFVFDGDGDRIAAVDGQGNFLSSQVLIPILIQHLAAKRGLTGEIVRTVSGSDLISRVAQMYKLPVYETPVGYKYIADRMLVSNVLLGGEESGGIGYADYIPERDGLLSALYLLEAISVAQMDLSELYKGLQASTDFHSVYDRMDLPLASMDVRSRLLNQLQTQPLKEIAGKTVVDCLSIDGYKFRLADNSWLMIRFSGTEPVLRLYCEAPTIQEVHKTLAWAKAWAE